MADRLFSADPIPQGARLACRVEYDGSHYNGWQSQPHSGTVTVQDQLELALSAVANAPVRVHCAGRTDSGVHAFSQVIHFDTPATRSCKAWVIGGNSNLPYAIRLHWAIPVSEQFHARFSAQARCYRYVIANTPIRPALLREQVTWHRSPLDARLMHSAGQSLLGERDFSAFRAASCQSRTPMRHVEAVSVGRRGELVILEITANAFLHHMVRNIAGALLAVGDQRRSVDWIEELLFGRDRTVAAETAPAAGLYLVDVRYPESFGLPATPYGPILVGTKP
ncbi:MAG: tRNA pseudouridine(38-40) synthase TruA [Halioglobus sp.]